MILYYTVAAQRYEVALLVRAPAWGKQALKVLGSISAAVYELLDLWATGLLQTACKLTAKLVQQLQLCLRSVIGLGVWSALQIKSTFF